MRDLRIRPLQLTDCAQVLELAKRELTPARLARIEAHFAELKRQTNQVVFVAVDSESKLWGWVHVSEVHPIGYEPRGMILKLVEAKSDSDIGERLLVTAESWCRERGHQRLIYRSKSRRLKLLEQAEVEQPVRLNASSPWPEKVVIYTDGASRGNPGRASIGVFVKAPTGEVLEEVSEFLGTETNNVAEYTALLRGLELAQLRQVREVVIRADSELMIKQMRGEYQVKAPGLKPIYEKCRTLARAFSRVQFEHVRREFNKEADRLANEALDR